MTRSWLFCPGDRPDRLPKAAAVADVVVADLEDAVAPAAKAEARAAVAQWLRSRPDLAPRTWVRVNNDRDLGADLDALAGLGTAGVVLPKAELTSVAEVAARTDAAVFALVETARGLQELPDLARHPAVTRLGLGEYDLTTELGADPPRLGVNTGPLGWARAQVVVAAAAAGLAPPPAAVSADLDDPAGFRADTLALQGAGFGGRLCIHPTQVALTHDVLVPTEEEVTHAQDVLRATEHTGVAVVAGRMVDAAVVRRARRVLALAAAPRESPIG
ncbi:aldolase/citrate lyase family protein [Amycolatopsis rhabdoformis]|uniref:Aldolase/citrate lyase family protein n=1 Tax=Amycolatopsis rhabdoformis TaxID=1448059 RepID=A0ABZ1IAZ7_9PSEU|nr:aldolase/citrate lyase family protein [Amycolatopsis rhabdoformis]WSE31580.1 aldolase/citrate lyase family protein [Amycolatopsis rhabdoformis]